MGLVMTNITVCNISIRNTHFSVVLSFLYFLFHTFTATQF